MIKLLPFNTRGFMDKVVHFDIPVDDVARAKKFYSIFGWKLLDFPEMDYVGVITSPVDEKHMPKEPGSINGGMMKRTSEVKGPTVAIHVKSVDESVKKVLAAGGKIVKPKTQIGEMGYYAYIADTEGNTIGLWETKS
jgi:uncharacterized protein